MIEFGGTIDRATYQRALRQRRGVRRFLPLAFILVGVVGFLTRPAGDASDPGSWGVYLFVTLFGVFLIVTPIVTARRQMSTNKMLTEPIEGRADERGIIVTTSRTSANLAWSDFYAATVKDDYVLLYTSAYLANVLTRTLFRDEASWSELRALVQAHVRPHPGARRTVLLLWLTIVGSVLLIWYFLNR